MKVKRHCIYVRMVHWLVAISTFILFFSGFGQMPVYERYFVTSIPGLGWTGDYSITLLLHYIFAIVLIFAAVFHLVYHGIRKDFAILPRRGDVGESVKIIKAMLGFGKEPPSDKYLAEQRLAYVFVGGSFLLVIVTGVIKILKNFPSFHFGKDFLLWNTNLHNLAAFLLLFGIVAHLGAFVFKENRKLLPGIFTGLICADYTKHRHKLWYDKLKDCDFVEKTTSKDKEKKPEVCLDC
ncbi:MAG: formate dehydrogenase subunit gamma [Bacillota bacterium]